MDNPYETSYKIALAEVYDVLKFSDESILEKIPKSFMEFLKQNKKKDYITNIHPYLPIEEQNLTQEAKQMLSLVYCSYIATEQEKEEFKKKNLQEQEELEKQKEISYSYENLFPKKNLQNTQEKQTSTALIVTPKQTIFQKLKTSIKHLFIRIFRKK